MPATIVRIERAGPESKARRLVFDDETTRLTSAAAVRLLALEPDAPLTPDDADALLEQVEPDLAKEHALRLLGYRDRSIAELRRKLGDAGYPPVVVDATVGRLRELDLLDDARFALLWARSRSSAGYGRRRVARELADKGVTQAIAAEALDEVFDTDDQVARARQLLLGAVPGSRSERDRLLRRLLSRGFDMSTALSALRGIDDGSIDEAP